MTICKIINNTCHKITCDLLFKRMTMKHVSSRHTPKRWGVKKATSKKVAKLELYKNFAAPPFKILDSCKMAVGSVYIYLTCGFQGRGGPCIYILLGLGEGSSKISMMDRNLRRPAWHLNNERLLISGEQRPFLWRTGKQRHN